MYLSLAFRPLITAVFLCFSCCAATAKEGMWLPPQLTLRAADMKAAGLKIPVSQIYNKDGTGLNNAVVLFGKGCTGELISGQGLVLTNHHCGYGTVQGLSTAATDYFANGFWAMSRAGELPCPGLTVTFVRSMENVTNQILYGLSDTLGSGLRDTIIARRIRALEKDFRSATKMDATIQPFYNGNQYWVSVTETFKDIRLVGFPPNGIGVFGGDTDNWMWPRHNADFSMFRIYAGADNNPADYNKENKPYQPKRFFQINTGGYKEGDFTMVYGFPGTTQEYISSSQLNQIQHISDPIRIAMRTRRLAIWKEAMNRDRDIFLKYTSKSAGIANGWKKWQGEVRGLQLNNVLDKKAGAERAFQEWASLDTTLPYADNLMALMQANTRSADSALKAEEYIREAALGIELIAQGALLDKWLKAARGKDFNTALTGSIVPALQAFLKNYDAATDEKVFAALMPFFMANNPRYVPQLYRTMLAVNNGNYEAWARNAFRTSLLARPADLQRMLNRAAAADTSLILADPAWQLFSALSATREAEVLPTLRRAQERTTLLNRLYLNAQMRQLYATDFYSDANLTLRVAYGTVHGIDPDGPAPYSYQTNLNEVIAKDKPGDPEFTVPEKLKRLYSAKDYGRWGVNGTVPVAFIADNHTSGGNSGSPVLNARGQLIGTNFDRIWEGTMSDLYFDPNLCRNISVDIRYTLFVVEKVGGAGWLLKEMKLVR